MEHSEWAGEILTGYDPERLAEAIDKNNGIEHFALSLSKMPIEERDRRSRNVTSLWLHLSHACNLRCRYCFADGGNYGKTEKKMDLQTVMRSVDWLIQANESGAKCRIVFFGGEPLTNIAALTGCVLYAEAKAAEKNMKFQFHLITNGTLLDHEIVDFLRKHNVSVQFSIDGPLEIHDFLRPYKGGKGSFRKTMEGLHLVRMAGIKEVSVRATVTHFNSGVSGIQQFLEQLSFDKMGLVPVQARPEEVYALTSNDFDHIRDEYRIIARDIIRSIQSKGEADLGCFAPIIMQMLQRVKKKYFCGAAFQFLSVTPDGSFSLCHRMISQLSGLNLGAVQSALSIPSALESFNATPVEEKKSCRECWVRYFCGGGCSAAAYARSGSFDEPDSTQCSILQSTVESALGIYDFIHSQTDFNFNYVLPGEEADCSSPY